MGTASFLLSSAQVPIDEAHFPDRFFRNYVGQKFDTNQNLQLDDEEIRSAVRMDLDKDLSTSCTSLKGLEFFTALRELNVLSKGKLAELDLNANVNLERLYCWGTKIQKLDLRQNQKLEYVSVGNTSSLSSLALDCPKLDTLILSTLPLGKLDVSASPGLVHLSCEGCQLATLDLRHCVGLKVLECEYNNLVALNLNEKVQLEVFEGGMQYETYVSPVDGCFDMAAFSGFDVGRSYDWDGVYRYGSQIVFNQVKPTYEFATAEYKYKTGVASGPGREIECKVKCRNEGLPVLLEGLGGNNSDFFYDADGDGKKEYYKVDSENNFKARYHWRAPGCYAQDFLLDLPFTYLQEDRMMTHLNNDGIPDFANRAFADFRKIEIALGGADGTYTLMDGCNSAYPLDVNHDGLPDLFAFNNTDWSIFYQNPDGTFTATRIDTISRVQADSLVAQKAEEANGKFDISDLPSLSDGMFIGGSPTVDESYKFTQAIDVNRDGYMDLVGPRTIFYNVGDNRFVASPQPGELTVKDLNGDGIPDYIYNDTEGKRVYTRTYLGGDRFEEQTLMKDLDVTNIYCYDFDKDGDVDILLTFDYLSSSTFSFLVFAENTGKGKFTIHEHSFKTKWAFGQCLDFDNDGYMELLAGVQDEGRLEYRCSSVHGLYLFRLDDMKKVEEPSAMQVDATFFYERDNGPGTDWQEAVVSRLDENITVADIDNDGRLELLADTTKTAGGYWATKDLPLLQGIPANEAPQRMSAPSVNLDRKSGKLKVAWKPGKDKETSTVDLTYALRIGSAPGKDDIYFSGANADGSRRDFRPGNMGANLDATLDVSRWKHGTYYIAIQTVDPMGKGSAWSDEVAYEHDLVQAAFTVSDDEPAAADTLVLTAASRAAGLDYAWDFDGGKAIKASADSAQVWLTFDVPGEKHLRLTVTNPADGTEDVREKVVTVQRVSWQQVSHEALGMTWPVLFWDMDGDGILDVLDQNGFYVNDGYGRFEKLGTIFNSNLTVESRAGMGGQAPVLDFDMDGDADFAVRNNKGNLILHRGGRDFEALDANPLLVEHGFADLDNDGFPELVDATVGFYAPSEFYVNKGDNTNFEKMTLDDGDGNWIQIEFLYDVNRDGLLDIFSTRGRVDGKWKDAFALNNGGLEFDVRYSPESEGTVVAFEDMDGDGVPDKVVTYGNDGVDKDVIGICFGNKDYTFGTPVKFVFENAHSSRYTVEVVKIADFDNNGCPDILVYYDFYEQNVSKKEYAILYMERDRSGRIEVLHNQELGFVDGMADVNHDGVPDFYHAGNDGVTLLRTGIPNTSPESPAHVRATQEGLGILLEWDDAYDKETPAMQMRYNVSVKKKGAEGEGAYIISPLNGGNDKTAVIPGAYYQKATRKMIPIERFEAGQEYEVQVQAIDLWDAHSPMSETYTFTVSEQFIAGPTVTAPRKAVALTYNVPDAALQTAEWDWDGGTLLGQEGKRFEVAWDEPGLKTVTVRTADGETATKNVMVRDIDLSFDFPTEGLAGTEITFTLPEAFAQASREDIDVVLSDERIEMLLRVGSREAKVVFPDAGDYSFHLSVRDSVCGVVESEEKHIRIVGEVPVPVIRLVGIDAATGKNKVMWDMPGMPDFVTTVNIYKESGRYNAFDCIAQVAPGAGEFVDTSSNPSVSSDRYCIKLGTTFGVESPASRVHSGTHLMLNKGVGGAVNLIWNAYEGGIVDSYRVLRGTSADRLELLAEVSGAHTAYTDLNAGDGTYFYALEYDETYSDEWQPVTRTSDGRSSGSGRSNVVCTDGAWTVVPAEQLNVLAIEKELVLTPLQPTLHLQAEILPAMADIRTVNWQITEGGELASLTQNGVLTAQGKENGDIVVCATTVDGTNIEARVTVVKKDFGILPQSVTVTTVEGTTQLTPLTGRLHLQASVQPENASQLVAWSVVQGAGLATLDEDGVLTPTETGNGDIVVRATSLEDASVYGELTLRKEGFSGDGVEGVNAGQMSVHRVGDDLWIEGLPEDSECGLSIVDPSGRVLSTEYRREGRSGRISLARLASGTYLLQVVTGEGRQTFRFFK